MTGNARATGRFGSAISRGGCATWCGRLGAAACLSLALVAPATAQMEQRIEVTIKDYTFVTKQVPLMLDTPTLIVIKNEDVVRHDFGSAIFHGTPTRIETGGVITYGRGVEGVFLDPGRETAIRFIIERPGRYQFKCSIHPDMKGELLLMSVGAV